MEMSARTKSVTTSTRMTKRTSLRRFCWSLVLLPNDDDTLEDDKEDRDEPELDSDDPVRDGPRNVDESDYDDDANAMTMWMRWRCECDDDVNVMTNAMT